MDVLSQLSLHQVGWNPKGHSRPEWSNSRNWPRAVGVCPKRGKGLPWSGEKSTETCSECLWLPWSGGAGCLPEVEGTV